MYHSDGSPPYALSALPLLVPQQRYDVSVHLSIPAVESNYALGNFMTTLTLSTTSNKTLTSVRRPVSHQQPHVMQPLTHLQPRQLYILLGHTFFTESLA